MNYLPWIGLVLLGIYELYTATNSKGGNTISEYVWYLSQHPIVPFAFGMLMAHFFWRR